MTSMLLRSLSSANFEDLKSILWNQQNGKCFICESYIDRDLQWDSVDIDHVIPLANGGKDDTANFALAHASCNRSKQASNLQIARMLSRFDYIAAATHGVPGRPHLGDILKSVNGSKYDLKASVLDSAAKISLPQVGKTDVQSAAIVLDKLSGMKSFFVELPIEYLHHDARINPRAISAKSLRALAEEFYAGYPQLHTALGWIAPSTSGLDCKVMIFDGQHKMAAQVMLGVRSIPVRVFVDPDMDRLLTANTHAGTKLRQVAFDKSVQRHLGSQLLIDRIREYQTSTTRSEDDLGFSEADLLNHFKGQKAEVKRYILDSVRDRVTHDPENQLREYIDFGGRSTDKPISYSTIEKTFYSFFIGNQALTTRIDYLIETGDNPRDLEVEQLVRLMNIVKSAILGHHYDPTIGTSRVERKIQEGKDVIPAGHIRAVRMCKEEILYTWLGYVRAVIEYHFAYSGVGVPFDKNAPMQVRFSDNLWDQIDNFVTNLAQLPLWQNNSFSASIFGGKQTYDWWRHTFQTGKSPSNQQVLTQPLDLQQMIK